MVQFFWNLAAKVSAEEDCPEYLYVLLPLTNFPQSNFRDADMFDIVDQQKLYDITGPLWVHISDLAPRLTSMKKGKLQGANYEVLTALLLKILVFRLLILHTEITCKEKIWNIELLHASVYVIFACNRTCKHSLFPRVVISNFFTTAIMVQKVSKTQ